MPRRTVKIGKRSLALDARPDRLDLRDRPYLPPLGMLPSSWPPSADAQKWLPAYGDLILDQGEDGACTGFGLAAVINYLHFVERMQREPEAQTKPRKSSAAMLYELARLYDEWPGEDYEGSSCRGALKGWHRHGVCREALWEYVLVDGKRKHAPPKQNQKDRDAAASNWDVDALACTLGVYYRIDTRSIVDMQAAIHQVGAIYCCANAHEGWSVKSVKTFPASHADLPMIEHVPSPKDAGGHAFAIVGYNENGFVVQNSWGRGWGAQGFALLPYADWVTHGEDAWVFTLGVPAANASMKPDIGGKSRARSPSYFVPASDSGQSDGLQRPSGLIGGSDSLERLYRSVPPAVQPLDTDSAYRHALVLDRGFPVRNDITARDANGSVQRVGYECPSRWLEANNANKVLIYAHGGLNSEGASITRIRALAPYALQAGIYPLFVTWRSGPLETVSDIVEEFFAKLGFGARGVRPAQGWLDRVTDRTDRILEPLMRAPGGALWQQMKLNANRASDNSAGGCRALVQHLAKLKQARPKLEIHMIGHSAGSIVLGAMLRELKKKELKVASLRLLAPACTVRFAVDHYKQAVVDKTLDPKHFHIHTLSEKNEQGDCVGPYQKSLLYLVSRAFEDTHKMPILGLERAFDPSTVQNGDDDLWARSEQESVREWLAFWTRLGLDATNRRKHVLSASRVSTGGGSIASSHGCFDNAVDILGHALGYVANPRDAKAVKIHRLDY